MSPFTDTQQQRLIAITESPLLTFNTRLSLMTVIRHKA